MSGDRLALVPGWVLFLPDDEQEYVLALVEIAKDMQRIAEMVPNAGRLDTQPVGIARAAIARLGSGAAEEDT